MQECAQILEKMKSYYNPANLAGMARFGINVKKAYGVPTPALRQMAREIRKNHARAQELWNSEVHDARILAAFIDDPAAVTEDQMERWVRDFDSWDVVDQCCNNLFRKTNLAYRKAVEWTSREEEYVKRAGFVLIACLAVHDKKARDEQFLRFLPIVKRASTDERNFVKKAVNWALRQIGKRNLKLRRRAIKTAKEILGTNSSSARWIAADALRELSSEKIQTMMRKRLASRPRLREK